MRASEFKTLFLFRQRGRGSYFDCCFVTPSQFPKDGEIYTYTGTTQKRDRNGCFGRRFESETGDTKVLTWQQLCHIDIAPFFTGKEAVWKADQKRRNVNG